MLTCQYLAFNLFHLDGLSDTADAFLGDFDSEKRHAILKDSRIGVYGLFAALASLALKAALLSHLLSRYAPIEAAILSYPIAGRFAAALLPCITKAASDRGLGALLKNARPHRAICGFVLSSAVWCIVIILTTDNLASSTALLTALQAVCGALSATFFARLYTKGIGGYTGDALGASTEIAELGFLFMAAVLLLYMV
jgi:adenosylcobinamide-GDP ribazoletransferase